MGTLLADGSPPVPGTWPPTGPLAQKRSSRLAQPAIWHTCAATPSDPCTNLGHVMAPLFDGDLDALSSDSDSEGDGASYRI
ncbi:hypothetical protein H4R19_004000 [Coemansia spiralis]|nr:hypothetical protein H4R19_004000 [Coemansia spiralis]